MTQAKQIRTLAAKGVPVEGIATRLGLRPAAVRRVLGRSAKRGAPRKREASTTLSFVTTREVATEVRQAASARGVPLSTVLEDLVVGALARLHSGRGKSAARPDASSGARARWPLQRSESRRSPRTAADAPEAVRKLLKSYDPKALRWAVPAHRHEVVVAILTRGSDEAKTWLWSVLSRDEARELVRTHQGAGCAEPARAILRRELGLTDAELPPRPHLGLGPGVGTP